MSKKIQLLDCTLRDGAYVVDGDFGSTTIKGIIKKMQEANIDIVECGWLKNLPYKQGSTFYHLPSDLEQYLPKKKNHTIYVAMIDWDRYNLENLPRYDGKSIDAIRVVFPQSNFREGIALGNEIKEKGYKVFFQAANTLGYSDRELIELAYEVNKVHPVCLSVVDTFGAMYWRNLEHILSILDEYLEEDIELGFHSHNNQQLSFSLSIQFIEMMQSSNRCLIVDSSLCGMGRGAGNATTELVANYLNQKWNKTYNLNIIMDTIDMFMNYFMQHYKWGYSIPYFISGMYCAHVNNIAYLLNNHRTNFKDLKNIIESLQGDERKKYDYDLLEKKYIEYQSKIVDDAENLANLNKELSNRTVLLLLPGKSVMEQKDKIERFIQKENPVIIGVNAIVEGYQYDYLFFGNKAKYEYESDIYEDSFWKSKKIVASNIKTHSELNEVIVNYNLLIKGKWKHFDNSGIMCMRLLDRLQVETVALAGFDGFEYTQNYADPQLSRINQEEKWDELNKEIKDMFLDFKDSVANRMRIEFVTSSRFE